MATTKTDPRALFDYVGFCSAIGSLGLATFFSVKKLFSEEAKAEVRIRSTIAMVMLEACWWLIVENPVSGYELVADYVLNLLNWLKRPMEDLNCCTESFFYSSTLMLVSATSLTLSAILDPIFSASQVPALLVLPLCLAGLALFFRGMWHLRTLRTILG